MRQSFLSASIWRTCKDLPGLFSWPHWNHKVVCPQYSWIMDQNYYIHWNSMHQVKQYNSVNSSRDAETSLWKDSLNWAVCHLSNMQNPLYFIIRTVVLCPLLPYFKKLTLQSTTFYHTITFKKNVSYLRVARVSWLSQLMWPANYKV